MKNSYTGDVAYLATMLALTAAMKSASIMLAKPQPIIDKSIDLLADMVLQAATPEVRKRIDTPAVAQLMANFVANCGLNTMTVLQLLKRFENACR